jgi:hypothetical protein
MEIVMRRLLLAGTAFLALPVLAQAADLPTKAPVAAATSGYPYAASGFYFGVGASSTAANADVANSGIVALGAGFDFVAGYQFKGGLDFIAPEVDITYTNLGNSGGCSTPTGGITSCSTNDAWEIDPGIKFGFPITTITNLLPNLNSIFPALPSFPTGVVATNVHPYIWVGAPFRDVSANYMLAAGHDWQVQPEIAAGFLTQWQQGLVIDTRAGCTIGQTGFNLSVAGLTSSTPVKSGLACTSRIEALY